MALNGSIAQTSFSSISRGTIVKHIDLEAITNAVSKLEGYAANVDNCGNCSPANCCQSQSCQSQSCQKCQSQTCQSVSCQSCQSCQGLKCQSQCIVNCNCNCSNCNC